MIQKTSRELHREGLKGVIEIIASKRIHHEWSFWFCLLIALMIPILIFAITKASSYQFLIELVSLCIDVFPNLLGFTLGGMAIVVGFSNSDLLKSAADDTAYSIYQKLSGIFSFHLLFQVIVLLLSFLLNWLMKIDFSSIISFHFGVIGDGINCIMIAILLFTSLYSIVLSAYSVLNLFNLSQINSGYHTLLKIRERKERDELELAKIKQKEVAKEK